MWATTTETDRRPTISPYSSFSPPEPCLILEKGASQQNIWGGGIDSETKNIDTVALINLRPSFDNNSQEILDKNIRDKFVKIVKDNFGL